MERRPVRVREAESGQVPRLVHRVRKNMRSEFYEFSDWSGTLIIPASWLARDTEVALRNGDCKQDSPSDAVK